MATDSTPVSGLIPHANFSVPMNSGLSADGSMTEEFNERGGNAVQLLLDWVDTHGCVGSNKSLLSFEKVVMSFQDPLHQDNMHWLEHFAYVWTGAGPYPPVTHEGWLEMACTPTLYSNEPPKLMNYNQVELVRRRIYTIRLIVYRFISRNDDQGICLSLLIVVYECVC